MNFINTTIVLGFCFTVGVLLCLSMCLVGIAINLLAIEIQARLLARKVIEKEIKQFNKEVELKERLK